MDSRTIDSEYMKSHYGFMFKKIAVPKISLCKWFETPEFRDAILYLDEHHFTIDNESVLTIMNEVYDEMEFRSEKNPDLDFNFYNARRSIKKLEDFLAEPKEVKGS